MVSVSIAHIDTITDEDTISLRLIYSSRVRLIFKSLSAKSGEHVPGIGEYIQVVRDTEARRTGFWEIRSSSDLTHSLGGLRTRMYISNLHEELKEIVQS